MVRSFFSEGGGANLLLLIWSLAYRALVLRRARRLVTVDRARYDAEWEALAAGPDGSALLLQLQAAAAAAAASHGPSKYSSCGKSGIESKPRQMTRHCIATESTTMACSQHSIAGAILPSPFRSAEFTVSTRVSSTTGSWQNPNLPEQLVPLTNLDVLYVQAVLIHPLLVEKVRSWAAVSKGLFPMNGPAWIKKLCMVCPGEDSFAAFKWARIKGVIRAIEKISRLYHKVRI